jgi:hypothetical protein
MQVKTRLFVRSMYLERAISAVLPVGSEADPLSGVFGMSDSQVDASVAELLPVLSDTIKRQIKLHREQRETHAEQQASDNGKKFSFGIIGGNVDDFKAGVTGRVGEPRDDLEKGNALMIPNAPKSPPFLLQQDVAI